MSGRARRRAMGGLGAALLTGGLFATPAAAFDLGVPTDKAAHFGVSYVLTDQLVRLGLSREEALAATLAAGWLKEVTDPRPDPLDMAANLAGALAAAYLRVELTF